MAKRLFMQYTLKIIRAQWGEKSLEVTKTIHDGILRGVEKRESQMKPDLMHECGPSTLYSNYNKLDDWINILHVLMWH